MRQPARQSRPQPSSAVEDSGTAAMLETLKLPTSKTIRSSSTCVSARVAAAVAMLDSLETVTVRWPEITFRVERPTWVSETSVSTLPWLEAKTENGPSSKLSIVRADMGLAATASDSGTRTAATMRIENSGSWTPRGVVAAETILWQARLGRDSHSEAPRRAAAGNPRPDPLPIPAPCHQPNGQPERPSALTDRRPPPSRSEGVSRQTARVKVCERCAVGRWTGVGEREPAHPGGVGVMLRVGSESY